MPLSPIIAACAEVSGVPALYVHACTMPVTPEDKSTAEAANQLKLSYSSLIQLRDFDDAVQVDDPSHTRSSGPVRFVCRMCERALLLTSGVSKTFGRPLQDLSKRLNRNRNPDFVLLTASGRGSKVTGGTTLSGNDERGGQTVYSTRSRHSTSQVHTNTYLRRLRHTAEACCRP